MAGIAVYFVPQLRAVGVPTVLGGVVIGLTLVAIRIGVCEHSPRSAPSLRRRHSSLAVIALRGSGTS